VGWGISRQKGKSHFSGRGEEGEATFRYSEKKGITLSTTFPVGRGRAGLDKGREKIL